MSIGIENIRKALRDVLGGGLDVNLPDLLRTLVEASVDTGVADDTSAVNHLDDAAKSWPVDAFDNLIVEITGGTGEGQIRKIASNTATSLLPVTNFDTAPDATSTYRIGFFGKMASEITAPVTAAGNVKQSIEERLISKTIRDIAPDAVGTFWLPEQPGHIDLSKFLASSWGIYAPTTAIMEINCYLHISHDGGTTWRRAAGYEILDTDFIRDSWNTIDCPLKLAEAKLEVVIETAYPAELDLMVIAKP